ncbi:MAG: PaaI family thioesterase [Lachnospiraceae bacterium]|nr:PaaI family thioesterase [Lachnospiraceae bacterium]
MAVFKSLDEAREYFKGDRYAAMTGAVLEELTEDHSVCSLILNDDHKNANGGIMGGVMFTLADLAFAALSNNIHMPTVAQQVSINYLSAPKGNTLTARAECKKNGARTIVVNIAVTDDTGRDIAQLAASGFKL